jgi:hypothetical protein
MQSSKLPQYISFFVKICDSNHRFSFLETPRLLLKELAIKICKRLNKDRFNTQISFSDSSSHLISITASLQQVPCLQTQLKATIYAKIKSSTITPASSLDSLKSPNGPPISCFDILANKNPNDATYIEKKNEIFFRESLASSKPQNLAGKIYAGLNAVVACVNPPCIAFKRIGIKTIFTPKKSCGKSWDGKI